MEVCHSERFLDSPAARRLAEYVDKRCEKSAAQNEGAAVCGHTDA